MSTTVPPAKVRAPRARGLGRSRLDTSLGAVWDHQLGLVVAPAGSGKTTLLAHYAGSVGAPVAWYRAEGTDTAEASLVAHLERAVVGVLDGVATGWRTVEDAAAAIEDHPAERVLVVIDDLHVLHGTAAEAALERFIE